ncbi:hypothetical protein SAMN04488561_1558 [Jiangella alba]|uniref:Uncharacterized protein n=1 Tax=Jiangella alba TaxID=561176 RepID=A0A1H5JF13_9ACTN|nr:hypothetical protein SAMN04488561_1558 [Jiangella alba]
MLAIVVVAQFAIDDPGQINLWISRAVTTGSVENAFA